MSLIRIAAKWEREFSQRLPCSKKVCNETLPQNMQILFAAADNFSKHINMHNIGILCQYSRINLNELCMTIGIPNRHVDKYQKLFYLVQNHLIKIFKTGNFYG